MTPIPSAHISGYDRVKPVRARDRTAGWAEARAIRQSVLGLAVVCLGLITAGESVARAEFTRSTVIIETDTDEHVFEVELALTPGDRARGLMFRTELAPDAGMLFDFGAEQRVSMWMRNTYVALDMLFADADGVILRIEPNTTPLSERIIESGAPVRYVLEVVAGTTERLNIAPGNRIVVQDGM